MKALCWHGKKDIRCDNVPDPQIEHPRDAIVKVTSCAICGSGLHLFDGFVPGMMHGDILGHEFMGEVVEVGTENKKLKVGDRVVVPFTISCGRCSISGRSATTRTRMPGWRKRCTATPLPVYSGTRTCWADMRAGRRNTCESRSPT